MKLDEILNQEQGVDEELFLFGFGRNVFDYAFQTATSTMKKPRKKMLEPDLRQQLLGAGGARERMWRAWQHPAAAESISPDMPDEVRRTKRNFVVLMRWPDHHMSAEKVDQTRSKQRVVWWPFVFRDKLLGFFRRDAPICVNGRSWSWAL